MMVMAGIGLAVGAFAYVLLVGIKGTARNVASGAASAVADVAAGTVEGIGQAVGIPVTNAEQCAAAKAAGDAWEASKQCPAGDFLGWWWSK